MLSLAACFFLASERLAIGSTEGGWLYGYGAPFSTRLLVVFLAASGLAVVPLLIPASTAHGRQWTVVALWIALATAAHVVIRSHAPFTLEQVFVSAGANAFYTVANEHEPSDVLRRFNRVREHGPLHVQSNMPGKIMLVEALQAVTTRTGVLPWLLVAMSNLGAVLMYLVVRDLFEDRRAALFSAALYLFVPARIFFFPLMNTVTPLLVLAGACLLLRWLRTGHTRYAVLMGILLYGLAFFEPLPLVMGLLFAVLSIRAIALGGIAWTRFAAQTVLMLLVFVATAEAVTASTGFSLFAAFRDIGGHAVAFNETAGRPYRLWIAANLREFVFGMGICQAAAFAGALVHGLYPAVTWPERLSRARGRRLPEPRGSAARHRSHRREPRRSDPSVDLPRLLLPNPGGVRLRGARRPGSHRDDDCLQRAAGGAGRRDDPLRRTVSRPHLWSRVTPDATIDGRRTLG